MDATSANRASVYSVRWRPTAVRYPDGRIGLSLTGNCVNPLDECNRSKSACLIVGRHPPSNLFCFAVVLGTEPVLDALRASLQHCRFCRLFSSYDAPADGITKAFPAFHHLDHNAPELSATWRLLVRCLSIPKDHPTTRGSSDANNVSRGRDGCTWLHKSAASLTFEWVVKVDPDTWLHPWVLQWMWYARSHEGRPSPCTRRRTRVTRATSRVPPCWGATANSLDGHSPANGATRDALAAQH